MKTSRNLSWSELKAGVVIVAALLLTAFAILQLGGRAGLFTKNYTVYMRLDNTYGLKIGSTVRLAGIDVGSVEDIAIPKAQGEKKVVVTLKIEQKYMDKVRQDSVASIKTMGLLGDKYVDITVGSPVSPALQAGGVLLSEAETQLSRVISGASSGLEGLNAVLIQMKGILAQVEEGSGTAGLFIKDPQLYRELASSAADIESVTSELKKGKGSLGRLVKEPDVYNNLLDISARTRELLDKLNKGNLARLSEDKALYENLRDVSSNLKDFTANLKGGSIASISSDKAIYARIDEMSKRLDRLMAKLESGQGSAGKLLSDEKLYNNMDKFFEDADALVVDVRKDPKKYMHISVF